LTNNPRRQKRNNLKKIKNPKSKKRAARRSAKVRKLRSRRTLLKGMTPRMMQRAKVSQRRKNLRQSLQRKRA